MLEHELVPKHELMTEEEIAEVLAKYGITKNQMPLIKSDDPAIKEMETSEGDVIKITRNNPLTGKSYYYRKVIEG